MENDTIKTDSLNSKFFTTYFSNSFLQEIMKYRKVTTRSQVNKIVRKVKGKESRMIMESYQNTLIGDVYGSIIMSELINKACLDLNYSPIGANDVINQVKGGRE
jgi:hypothetical protein